MEKYGGLAVFIARFLPGLRFAAGPVAGATGMRAPIFFVANVLGACLYVPAVVGIGWGCGRAIASGTPAIRVVAVACGTLAVLCLIPLALHTVATGSRAIDGVPTEADRLAHLVMSLTTAGFAGAGAVVAALSRRRWLIVGTAVGGAATLVAVFLLRVTGDSMIDAAIADGDWVVVRQQPVADNGDIVAAMIDGEATVKTYRRRDGHVWLLPHNPAYAPIPGDEATVLGRVVTVLRKV